MSRRTFTSGVLVEEWDDAALVHGALADGVWTSRPYTAEEVAAATPTPPPDPLGVDLDDLTVALLAAL